MLADGKPLFELALGEVMQYDDGQLTLDLRSGRLVSKRDGLVGFPGIRFQPRLVEAPNAKYATSAWSWLNNRVSGALNTAAQLAMASHYICSIRAGFNFAPLIPMQMSSRLFALRQRGMPINDKLTELRRSLRGITRRSDDSLDWYRSFMVFDALNSEAKVANLLARLGHPVSFGVKPDMSVDGIGIEVKNILQSLRGDPRYIQNLRERAQQIAHEQHAQIVIFDLGQYLNFFGHDSLEPFSRVIKRAMCLARTHKKRISAILLSDSPSERSPRGHML